jgi:hypothetical protein
MKYEKNQKMKIIKVVLLSVIIPCIAIGAVSCHTLPSSERPKAKLEVSPAETFLSPALIIKPVTFKGSGFAPNEMIAVEMVLPSGMKMKGLKKGENRVGIAVGNSDDEGNFTTAMKPMATLNTFYQVGWTSLPRPNFKEARPIPPGVYTVTASGLDSDIVGTSSLKIVLPPKKKE